MKKSTLIAEFDQAVHIVDSSFPSLYTKEDVIKVLRDLEEKLKVEMDDNSEEETTTKINITEEQIKEIAENAASSISSQELDLVEDYDLSMSYREVELDSLTLDESRIAKEIERAITNWFESNAIEIN
jgi:broad-specificity NMP kinase